MPHTKYQFPTTTLVLMESAKTTYTAVAKYFEGKTLHQIAADLGLSRITIARWLRKW